MTKVKCILKYTLAVIVYYSGLLWLLCVFKSLLFNRSGRIILMYHRIIDPADSEDRYTQPGMNVSRKVFEKQVSFLAAHYNVMPLQGLIKCLKTGKQLPRRAAIITFDDGWRDNFLYAYPVLQKYHIPATIFLTTDFIDTNRKFWFLRVGFVLTEGSLSPKELAAILEQAQLESKGSQLSLPTAGVNIESIAADSDRFIEQLKQLNPDGIERVIEEIVRRTGLTEDKWPDKKWMLTWEDINKMSPQIIEFGSHSRSHHILTTLKTNQIRQELVESRKVIEEKTDRQVLSFAYPNGNYSDTIKELTRETGYNCGMAICGKTGGRNRQDIYALQRIGIHDGISTGPGGKFSRAMFALHLVRYS